jgi:hypothetical protein
MGFGDGQPEQQRRARPSVQPVSCAIWPCALAFIRPNIDSDGGDAHRGKSPPETRRGRARAGELVVVRKNSNGSSSPRPLEVDVGVRQGALGRGRPAFARTRQEPPGIRLAGLAVRFGEAAADDALERRRHVARAHLIRDKDHERRRRQREHQARDDRAAGERHLAAIRRGRNGRFDAPGPSFVSSSCTQSACCTPECRRRSSVGTPRLSRAFHRAQSGRRFMPCRSCMPFTMPRSPTGKMSGG